MVEIWKDITGYEGIYQVSNYGNIKSLSRKIGAVLKKDRIMIPAMNNGYCQLVLENKEGKRKLHRVHRVVAQMFLPNPENKSQVNHKNGIRNDNHVSNLEWCTPSENLFHSYQKLNRKPPTSLKAMFGKVNPMSKPIVCSNGKQYDCINDAARDLKVFAANISKVLNNERFHTGGYKFKYA